MTAAERLLTEALGLPERERADLAARLLESLLESLDEADGRDVDEDWAAEIERRCAAIDAGDAVTSDWNQVRQRIEREIFGR